MRAVFLDVDGVIIREVDLIKDEKDMEVLNEAGEAIKLFNRLGFAVIAATNRPQVARGLCSEDDIKRINSFMESELMESGARIDAVYYCPHHPEKRDDIPEWARKYRIECRCRKPDTGMLEEAAKKFDIDVKNSYMIGDRTVDIETGKRAGCKTVLVKTGYGGRDGKYNAEPDFVCSDIYDAAKLIERLDLIKAVILAGGRGERMRPLTDTIPKPLLPVNGKSVLEHQLALLKKYVIKDALICGHYLFSKIEGYFGDGKKFGISMQYIVEREPLGTGGAIKNAEAFLKSTFLVIYGDEMIDMDISRLLKFHINKGGLVTVVAHGTDHPADSDLIETNKEGLVTGFFPKGGDRPDGLKISKSSVYVIEPAAFKFIGHKCDFDRDVLPELVRKGVVFGYLTGEYIKDMGTFERYEKVKARFEDRA